MDIFAIVLITVTLLTICGICLFIFICSLQSRLTRYIHQKRNKTYHIMASTQMTKTDENFDLSTLSPLDHQDKRAYLKILERSVRSGRRIQDEKENNAQSHSIYSLRQYMTNHIPSSSSLTTTNDNQRSTDI